VGQPDLWAYDLRGAAKRNMERAGISRSMIKLISGHKTDLAFNRHVKGGTPGDVRQKREDALPSTPVEQFLPKEAPAVETAKQAQLGMVQHSRPSAGLVHGVGRDIRSGAVPDRLLINCGGRP
jgi:hypothetical protein